MTLVFIGHNFKYQAEAVCKLFFPAQTFSFLFFNTPNDFTGESGDICVLTKEYTGDGVRLSAFVRIGESEKSLFEDIKSDVADLNDSIELRLSRLAFLCLRELTGVKPVWGLLTGVRPVKLVRRLLDSGKTENELLDYLTQKLYLSENKASMALITAKNQCDVICALPPRSVSLYVSIPFCPSRCSYCSFVSQTVADSLNLIPKYVDRLCEEIRETARIVTDLGIVLDTVYIGGGTPTAIREDQLRTIMEEILRDFDLSRLREYTVEAGRPDTVTREKLEVIKAFGGDRVSINPQTLEESVLKAVGRRHTAEQFYKAFEFAEGVGFTAINVDLIAGLPSDSFWGFESSLRSVIALKPDNITVHALSIKRAADLRQEKQVDLDARVCEEMVNFSGSALTEAGYAPYYLYRQKDQLGNQENVGWERGGAIGVYNINIMEEIQTVLAVGAGGSTKIVADPETAIERLYNPKYPFDYIRLFDETVIPRKRAAFEKIGALMEG